MKSLKVTNNRHLLSFWYVFLMPKILQQLILRLRNGLNMAMCEGEAAAYR